MYAVGAIYAIGCAMYITVGCIVGSMRTSRAAFRSRGVPRTAFQISRTALLTCSAALAVLRLKQQATSSSNMAMPMPRLTPSAAGDVLVPVLVVFSNGDQGGGGGGAGAPTAQPNVLMPPVAALASVQLVSPPPLTQPLLPPQHSLQQESQLSSEPATMPAPKGYSTLHHGLAKVPLLPVAVGSPLKSHALRHGLPLGVAPAARRHASSSAGGASRRMAVEHSASGAAPANM